MTLPILVTKLHAPPPRPRVIPRRRLIERLDQGLHRKLTLISAPAGFGKSTLLGEWIAGCDRPAAWLSLDEGDSDPARFLGYLVAALRTVAPDLGSGILQMVETAQPLAGESILTALLNEIAALPHDIMLVLDDYHLVDNPAVDQWVAFLVEHLPPRLHLVIASRVDPPLPLARLRARGESTELRAADLRFTTAEAVAFLNEVMGLALSEAEVATLEQRTEGWIAGLQLAALSMQGQQDVPGFIREFAGNHRYIVDYLVEEVLRRQPAPVRDFLLQTAILDRLCGPLCDAVTGQDGGSARLEALERANVFVIPLDDHRRWYRYHHLFADVLRAHLAHERPDLAPPLHGRASRWYEAHDEPAGAFRHALAAGDNARAADLVELAASSLLRARQEATLLAWLRALPDDVIRCRPVLSDIYAGTLMSTGELDGVETRLRDAEGWLEAQTLPPTEAGTSGMAVADHDAFRRLPVSVAVHRAGYALVLGNVDVSIEFAGRAISLAAPDDHLTRGAASAIIGLAAWREGNLETAHRAHADGMASLHQAGYVVDAIGGVLALVDIRIAQGRLREARATCERSLELAARQGGSGVRGTADMHVALGDLARERNDLAAAREHLRTSHELGEHAGFPQHPWRRRLAMARLLQAEGDMSGVMPLIDDAEHRYTSDFFPNARPLAAIRARIRIAQGQLDDALAWARERALSVDDEPSYLTEYEHITLASILIARARRDRDPHSMDDAMGLLARLLPAAEAGGRGQSVIEILILQALGHEARGDIAGGLGPLARALALAEPEGYARLFIDEGPPMTRLLVGAIAHGVAPVYARRLLAAGRQDTAAPGTEAGVAAPGPLAGILSQRELEVTRLIAQGLSNREIGDRLFLVLDTVKGHNRRIFDKLDVRSRSELIARARELGLHES